MTAQTLLAALDLPIGTLVEQRVPKTLLREHGASTATDKRRLDQNIERLVWVASLKPGAVGFVEHRDEVREYLEIAVLHLTLRNSTGMDRLIELVHRAIPYPSLLVTDVTPRGMGQQTEADEAPSGTKKRSRVAGQPGLHLSLAHKRWSQSEVGKTVLDGEVLSVGWSDPETDADVTTFLGAMAMHRQRRGSLFDLYQGWMDTLVALLAARRTGRFTPGVSTSGARDRQDALGECERLEAEMARLRSAAAREKQMARLVALNRQLQQLRQAHAAAMSRL